jgi:hypothetical protein
MSEEIKNEAVNPEKKTLKEKISEKANVAKEAAGNVVHFVAENAGAIVPIIFGGASLVMGIARMFSGQDKMEARYSSDDFTGERYLLNHPLANGEILELSEKMEGGMTKGEALKEMGVLSDEKKRK